MKKRNLILAVFLSFLMIAFLSIPQVNAKGPRVKIPAPIPQTGQTDTYSPGDDGDLQIGVPWPDPRFTDKGDGTVRDNLTGLIWLKNANCFEQRTWADALSDCNSLQSGSCGLTDGSVAGNWSLPNIREIHSLIDYGADNPALPPGNPFTGVVCSSTDCSYGYYWSSTTVPVSLEVYSLYLGGGFVNEVPKSHLGYRVWCVRGGQ